MYEQKYRVLNRHRRGRPKYDPLKKIWLRLTRRMLPILLIVGILAALLFIVDRLGFI